MRERIALCAAILTRTKALSRQFALFGAAIVFIASSTTSATAKNVMFPETGDVAFVLQIPDTWRTTPGSGSLKLTPPDESASITFLMFNDKDVHAVPNDDFAKAIATNADCKNFKKTGQSRIGDRMAEAYSCKATNPQNVMVDMKMLFLKIGQSYVAIEMIGTPPLLSEAQRKSLDAVLKGITLKGDD